MRHSSKRHPVITLDDLKEKTGTKKRDKALKKYIEELLTEYANPPTDKQGKATETAWIKGFKPIPQGYEIYLINPPKIATTKKNTKKTAKKSKKP